MNEKDPEIDDILQQLKDQKKKKKRINSSRKGKRAERDLCKTLSDHFQRPFAKKPDDFGSGAWSTTHQEVQEGLDLEHMCGDIIGPKGFRFAMESKKGYAIEAFNLFPGGRRKKDSKQMDEFIEQAERDSGRVGKSTLIFYRKDYCPCICFVKREEEHWFPDHVTKILYKNYIGVSLDDFLSLPEAFFFVA